MVSAFVDFLTASIWSEGGLGKYSACMEVLTVSLVGLRAEVGRLGAFTGSKA